jgi:hypothetical protein
MACKVLQYHPTEDRIVIDTGCKIFDRQCTYLAQGNHWGNCQFSSYVRPVSETECNGRTVPTGELFDFDITAFKEMPPHVRSEIRAMNQTVVVSEIRHHIGPHRARCKVVHGYVVANSSDRLIRVYQTNSGAVSQRILDTVVPFITDVNAAKAA